MNNRWLSQWLLAVVLATSMPTLAADTLAPLLDAKELELSWQLRPARTVVPGERVRIDITIATRRWFTGGTRIQLPSVPNLLLKQNQQFATNASERRADGGWTLQRWTLDASAVAAGIYKIPPITLRASIAGEAGRSIEGSLRTDPIVISAATPAALLDAEQWVASPAASLAVSNDAGGELAVGDAVKRVITVTADDVLALQLPVPPLPELPGLQAYRQPPLLRTRANRGKLQGERRDTQLWIATEPGTYAIPGIQMNWWDTTAQRLVVLSAPATTVTVTGDENPIGAFGSSLPLRWLLPLALVGLMLALLARRSVSAGLSVWGLRVRTYIKRGLTKWRQLSAPALPQRLNPGGSDSAPAATSPPPR